MTLTVILTILVILQGGLTIAGFLMVTFFMKILYGKMKENRSMIQGVDTGLMGITRKLIHFERLALRVETVVEKIKLWSERIGIKGL